MGSGCERSRMGTTVVVLATNVPCDDEGHIGYGFWPWSALALVVLALSVFVAIMAIRKKRLRKSEKGLRCEQSSQGKPLSIIEKIIESTMCVDPCPLPMDSDWKDFVSERLEELRLREGMDETKWALGVVDFLDELKESDAEASSRERDISAALRNEMLDVLSSKGFAVVDSETWNPDLQRAVAVVRKPNATETKILGKGATGLSRNGKIIRKQEVKIEMKGD